MNEPRPTEEEKEIIDCLTNNGELTRSKICDILHAPRSTIYDRLDSLRRKGIVSCKKKRRSDKGRPYIIWFIGKYEESPLFFDDVKHYKIIGLKEWRNELIPAFHELLIMEIDDRIKYLEGRSHNG